MLTRTGPVYGPNAFSDLKDDEGRSEERPRASDRLTATDLRRELAAILKTAADKADEWRIAAHAEWAPLAPVYHAGSGEVTAAIEGPYIEHRLSMATTHKVRALAEYLAPEAHPLSQEEAEDIARAGIEAYKDAELASGRRIPLTAEGLNVAAFAGQRALEAREPGQWMVGAAAVDHWWRHATFIVKRRRPGDAL